MISLVAMKDGIALAIARPLKEKAAPPGKVADAGSDPAPARRIRNVT